MRMKKEKAISFLLLFAIVMSLFTGCGDQGVTTPGGSSGDGSNIISSTDQVNENKPVMNPFTGEYGYDEALLAKRPVAVMINNISVSLPQSGLSDADIIYELPVEGPITRLMAVYSDYSKLPNIGSIRSARHDFVELLVPLNAIYLHFGESPSGKQAIKDNKVDDIDGLNYYNVAFYQDQARKKSKGTEHSWFSNAELFQKGLDKTGFKTTMEPISPLFSFIEDDKEIEENKVNTVTKVTAPQSGACIATFTYDEATKTYKKGQYGKDHIDANYNKAASVTNVFVLYTDAGLMADKKHKEVNLSNGSGYYISYGKAVPVTYKKDSIKSMMKFYDESGAELKVNTGKTWICIADNSQKSKLVIDKKG